MIFRPSESSKKITDFYRRYLLTSFNTNNEKYNIQFKRELEKNKAIADGPYISMTDPYKKGKKISELVEEGILVKEMLKLKKFHPDDRNLYKHQEEAILKSREGKNLIVTTGTGSGKTESFLIPVINQLLEEKEKGTLGPGVRTLIIYPMNALVNDQIRRIREILYDMDAEEAITFGRFTGETKEKQKDAEEMYKEVEDSKYPWRKNEIISREQMRITPPNILITNYAMLEYILLRPGDNIILREQYADKWQYIVLDEAHSYNGANGIEVATLLKRVKAMLKRDDLQYILTSATLGDKKSNNEILQFAQSLCDSKFDENSIIRSYTNQITPQHDLSNINFNIYKELAQMIRKNENEKIEEMLEHLKLNGKTNEEKIFDLVLHDKFYYNVRDVLYRQIKSLSTVARELNISVEDFTDFIAVASNGVKNSERLFEAKYHMFLRGIEGVFVTLKPLEKLFINKMDIYKENPNDIGYKVYEISFCNNCNALFITGNEIDGHLVQKFKFNNDYSPEVYLLRGEYDPDDEDNEDENTYQICSRCGEIKKASSVNGLQCGHGTKYINKIVKVKTKGEILNQCPCCHSSNSKTSILRPYYLGNEAATAVISTALYNELPNIEHHETVEIVEDEFFGRSKIVKDETKRLEKQFLAFSDGRQSAAFFASYLGSTYRTTLIKRIMYEMLQENENEFVLGMSVEKFALILADKIKKYNVLPNASEHTIQKEAWIQILLEMSNYKAKNSLLKNGFLKFEVDFDLPEIKKLNLSIQEVNELFKEMTKYFMKDAAVDTGITFSEADVGRFTFSGFQKGYECEGERRSNIEPWMPAEKKTNKRLKYLLKILDNDEESARKLLRSTWQRMCEDECIKQVEFRNNQRPYQLNINKIKVKKIDKLYICEECKNVTAYNVRGKCTNPRCNGKLVEYHYKEKLIENHYYNLYTKLNISPMIVKEHTAQLSSDKAYEYQKEFKNKEINVLSCSTTFEMGVDVGSLETVFMRNMPPSPANYAQRAGRAGRSLKSAAYAVTFCPNSSHDLNYFKNPVDMIEGKIVPPVLNVSNEKIVLRHIFASAFSFFWKNNVNMYMNSIGKFIDNDGFKQIKDYIDSKPEELKNYLNTIVPDNLKNMLKINSFEWNERLFNPNQKDGIADIALNKYKTMIKDLEKEKNRRFEENKPTDWIKRSIDTLRDQRIIDFLSKNNIIPKYGFPVDSVELQEPPYKNSYSNNINLSRDLLSAISEYAPESEIVADGKLYKSRYIKKIAGYEWPKYNYFECDECHTLTREPSIKTITECKQCGNKVNRKLEQYIIPKFGFVLDTEGPKEVGVNKPEKTYRGQISYIGDENQVDFKDYIIGEQRISIGNSKMDSLAVLNKSDFYICESCGYGKVSDKFYGSIVEYKHNTAGGHPCNGWLHKYTLGHEFQTDVVFLKFRDIDMREVDRAWTILYSLLEGLCRALNIDRKELAGCIQWYRDNSTPEGNYGCILFDNTPGGAGYVRKLENKEVFINMLKYGKRVVNNCDCGGEAKDTACYSCLCNYYNQRQHEILKRIYAIDFFEFFCINDEINSQIKEIELDNSKYEETKEIIKEVNLKFKDQGGYQESFTIKEIWKNLAEDCDNDDEISVIEKLTRKSEGKNIEKPIYNEIATNTETNEEFMVNELWRNKKVMLFLTSNYDDYLKAKKTGWKCFCTSERIDIDEFLKLIEV